MLLEWAPNSITPNDDYLEVALRAKKMHHKKRGWLYDIVCRNFCFSCGSTIYAKKQNWGNVWWEYIRPLANKSLCACCFSKKNQSFSNFSKHSKIKINIHTVFRILVVVEYTDRFCVFLQRTAQNRHHKGIWIVVVPKNTVSKNTGYIVAQPTPQQKTYNLTRTLSNHGPNWYFFILLAWCFSNPEKTIDKSNNFLLHFISPNWYNHPISPTREVRETSFTGTSTSALETGLKSMVKAETVILAAGITVGMVSLSPFVLPYLSCTT